MRRMLSCRSGAALATAGAVLLLAGAANALSITYFLSQSNDPEGWLPDSTKDYASVTIADNGSDIDFTVTLLSPLTSIADSGFGIARFLFNSANVLTAANIVGEPGDWATAFNMQGNGFGTFDVELTAGTRQDPTLSFSITGIAGDTPLDYALLNPANDSSQGDSFFAVHVAGFTDQDLQGPVEGCVDMNPPDEDWSPQCNILTSAWFGGDSFTPIPEPATALLVGLGLAGLTLASRQRR